MKKHKIALLLIFFISRLFSPVGNAQVTGRVTDVNQQPIPLVNIKIQDADLGTQTNTQGEYAIDAYPGDKLLFSHIGMEPVVVRVKRNVFVINIVMASSSIELEEVEIAKKTTKVFMTQKEMLKAFPENKRLIKTAYGIINTDIASGSIRIIDGEDLSPGLPITEALLAHLHLHRYAKVWFDIDGFLFNDEPPHINSSDIDRIAILGGYETAKRYGSQAQRGMGRVIVINTKAQTWMDDMGVDRSDEFRQLLDSSMRVTHLEPYKPYVPPYLEKLQKLKREKKALVVVEEQQSNHLSDPYYFLEIYELFLSRWGNNEKPKELSNYIIDNFSEDVPILKALAYIKQRHGYYLDALAVYTEILTSHTWYAQPLRDLANSYAEIGENENAWWYYSQYIKILDQLPDASFDQHGTDQLIATEMMNILQQNQEFLSNSETIITSKDEFGPQVRLVFEWNNPEAEFELQFVTPEGFYDTWGNGTGNDESQNQVSANRYSSHQFFIGEENIGLWQVNIHYRGNDSDVPTYLKVSTYRNYGLPSQQTEIMIYKLYRNHEKVQLFTLLQE